MQSGQAAAGDLTHLLKFIFAEAEAWAARPAFISKTQTVTYSELQARVEAHALHLLQRGVSRTSCVVIAFEKPLPGLIAALALALVGCPWVQATPAAASKPELFPTHVLTSPGARAVLNCPILTVDEDWDAPPPGDLAHLSRLLAGHRSPDDIFMYGQSSGSTGEAKFFPITIANFIRRTAPEMQVDPAARPVIASMFHMLHGGNLSALLRAVKKGGTIVYGTDKALWLNHGVTMAMGSPSHFAHVFDGAGAGAAGKLPLAWVGGGPIYPAFLERAFEHFGAIANFYGVMEGGTVSWKFLTPGMALPHGIPAGRPNRLVELQIVDGNDMIVPAMVEGTIRYKSPWATEGYVGDSRATHELLRNGWVYPADRGFLDEAGELYVTGRDHDVLVVGGQMLNAAAMDAVLQAMAGVADGLCFNEVSATGHSALSVAVVVLPAAAGTELRNPVTAALVSRFGRAAAPTKFYVVEAIPRNLNGKLLRRRARELAESRAWLPAAG